LPAFEALEAALNHKDPEIALRAWHLLHNMHAQWADRRDPPAVQEILQDYGLQTWDDRARRIIRLAFLWDLTGTAAACRLVRFERQSGLSDFAAIQILYSEPFDSASRVRFQGAVEASLAGSNRPAAKWLLAYVRLRRDAKTALPEWTSLVESQCARCKQAPDVIEPEIAVGLRYLLALGLAAEGDQTAAESTAEQARQMPHPSDSLGLNLRTQTAYVLARRGRMPWAEKEYGFLMKCGDPVTMFTAGGYFAEFLYAHREYQAAAEVYQQALAASSRLQFRSVEDGQARLKRCRARMNYFWACHWAQQHDAAKQLDSLERALQDDPSEADTLIACYRLSDPTPQFRERVAKLLQEQTAKLRDEMVRNPKANLPYNHFAWLVGNTRGDLDEALRASRKSLELSPNNASYLDTLAHVYFAKGDLADAVKYQTMAVERDPHSEPFNAALTRFRTALEERAAKTPH
jgi:tetratricopeptide (TPR) repeat protein